MTTVTVPAEVSRETISLEIQEKINRLMDFKHPRLKKILFKKKIISSDEEYEFLFTECKKYICMGAFLNLPIVPMLSKKVDDVWHYMILLTRDYFNFCEKYIGRYLHHQPNVDENHLKPGSQGHLDFEKWYKKLFGDIPSVWNLNMDANCCSPDTYEGYRDKGGGKSRLRPEEKTEEEKEEESRRWNERDDSPRNYGKSGYEHD